MTLSRVYDNIIKSRAKATDRQAAVAQAVERRIGSAEVTGPIPVSSFERGDSLEFPLFLYLDKMVRRKNENYEHKVNYQKRN